MKLLAKIFRWAVVIFAALSTMGSLMTWTIGAGFGVLANPQSEVGVFIFWLVVGGIALYFELRSEKAKTKA